MLGVAVNRSVDFVERASATLTPAVNINRAARAPAIAVSPTVNPAGRLDDAQQWLFMLALRPQLDAYRRRIAGIQ